MNDEDNGMSEPQQGVSGDQERPHVACMHAEAVGKRWGDPISEERQAELEEAVARQKVWLKQPEASRGRGPFSTLGLTGADVYWVILHFGASFYGFLEKVEAMKARHLPESWERIEQDFVAEQLDRHFEGAWLSQAHLEGAELAGAHFEGANLEMAHLEGADLSGAYLDGANLFGAEFDEATVLIGVSLGPEPARDWFDQLHSKNRNASLGDIKWRGVNLTSIAWDDLRRLGDERYVVGPISGMPSPAVVAYRQVATQLRAQGISDAADHFSYRAHMWQRKTHLLRLCEDRDRPWRWPGELARYISSLFLGVLAGYGYRPGRTFLWYILTILSFMGGYLLVTQGAPFFGLTEPHGTQPLRWYEALVLSVASFHGRGFFPQGINLGDPVAVLAAGEAVIGLFIEISFIATFTQRYFSR